MQIKPWLIACILFLTTALHAQQVPLFNKKDLTGWDTYIGPELNDSGVAITIIPVGLNKDPLDVFSVVDADGE